MTAFPDDRHDPASLSDREQRNVGIVVHAVPAAALVLSAGTLGFVASLVIYLMYKDRGEYARRQAANSLNIQIVTGVLLLVSLVLVLVLVGFLTYPLVIVWAVVLHVLGAVRASNGEPWDPPLTPRLVR
jgi:uncharacterized Tic20 family protein